MKKLKMVFNLSQAKLFANLSGDYNPMHLDENYSRRLIYGEPVAHGINVFFQILEKRLILLKNKIKIKYLKIKFIEPIYYEKDYELNITNLNDKELIVLSYKGKKAIEINLIYDIIKNFKLINSHSNLSQNLCCNSIDIFDAIDYDETLNYRILSENFIFPNSYKQVPFKVINFLIATSYIVGMKIPGLNSIFSQIELKNISDKYEKIEEIKIQSSKVYRSVNLLKLNVYDNLTYAKINCFFRPTPVLQPSFKQISNLYSSNEFDSHHLK